jgi:hypothetical protein
MKQVVCEVCGGTIFSSVTGPSGPIKIVGEEAYYTTFYMCEVCKSTTAVHFPCYTQIRPDEVYVAEEVIVELAFPGENNASLFVRSQHGD